MKKLLVLLIFTLLLFPSFSLTKQQLELWMIEQSSILIIEDVPTVTKNSTYIMPKNTMNIEVVYSGNDVCYMCIYTTTADIRKFIVNTDTAELSAFNTILRVKYKSR